MASQDSSPSALVTIGQNIVTAINALKSTFTATPSGIADVRNLGAVAGVNCQPAVARAVQQGFKHVFLPAGFFYQGGGTGAQAGATEIPAGVEIIGENPQTSLIKAVDRTNSGVPGFIYLNSFSALTTCGTQSFPGDQQTSPAGVHPKTVMQPRVANYGDAKTTYVPWTGSTVFNIGAAITSPEGVVSIDNPGIQIVQGSTGDAYYAGVAGSGVGLRIQTYGTGDEGLLLQNGVLNSANLHNGIHVTEAGTNAASSSVILERLVGGTAPLFLIKDDNIGAPDPTFAMSVRVADASSGQFMFAGTTKAVRLWSNASTFLIEGVDTGATSFQPLTIGGSTLTFQILGATAFSSLATALLAMAAATAAKAQFNLAVGGPPTLPNDGDIWFESNTLTGLKMRIAGVTRTVTLT